MKDKYLVIHNSILPDIFEKVLLAKKLVEEQNKSVSTVCKELDISRSTFYKYKDKITTLNATSSSIINIKIVKTNSQYAIIDTLNKVIMNGGKIVKVDSFLKEENLIEINIYFDSKDLNVSLKELINLILNDLSTLSATII